MDYLNNIQIDTAKCAGCGLCKLACPSMLLDIDENGKAVSRPVDKLNWYGCWKCQHCMAVCPEGAISVMGKDPSNSLGQPSSHIAEDMDALVAMRRSYRHFKQENVDSKLVDHLFEVLANCPSGGNKQLVEFTLIDDIDKIRKLYKLMDEAYLPLMAQGQYPPTWDQESMDIMKSREDQAMNGDQYFCSAPHIVIAHMPAKFKSAPVDCTIALTYFELICNAHGLGTVFLGFPMNILKMIPDVMKLLGIPEDHHIANAIGFGYPTFTYSRGVQKDMQHPIHRPEF